MFPLFARSIGEKKFTLSYIGSAINTSGTGASQSLGSFSIPRAGLVVVTAVVFGENSRRLTGISIGGSAASVQAYPTNNYFKYGFGWREVPAGSHAVSLSLSNANGSFQMWQASVFLIENYKSATPYAYSIPAVGTGSSRSITLSLNAGGCAIYAASMTKTESATWSSATVATHNNTSAYFAYTSAFKAPTAAGTHTETVSVPGGDSVMFGAAWR